MNQDNARIWKGIIKREEAVFEELYFRCYDSLFKYGLQKLNGDQMKVTAFIDEVFAEIWEKGASLPQVENVEGYLFIIFKRKVFRFLKQKKIYQPATDEWLEQELETTLPYEKLLIQMQTEEELRQRVARALKSLSPRQLQIIQLKYFKECSVREMAYQLQLTPRTIYNTLHAGLKVLREELEGFL